MMRTLVVFLVLLTTLACQPEQVIKSTDSSSESAFEIGETFTLHSDILGEERILNIYLPEGYTEDSTIQYPVIYVLDGSKDEDFIHLAGLNQFLSFPWIDAMPPSIVVGVSNVDRQRDFTTPSQNALDLEELPTSGGADAFTSFLQQELLPEISRRYRVLPERTLVGQSLGGLLASQVLVEHTDLFSNYLIVSPSMWWNDEEWLNKSIDSVSSPASVFIAVGAEGPVMERGARSWYELVSTWEGVKSEFLYLKECNHGDALHLAAYQGFKWFHKKEAQ